MIDERERFERAFELFEMPDPAFERLERRRDRKTRNQRVAATVVAVALVLGSAVWFRSLVSGPSRIPLDHPLTPRPTTTPTPVPTQFKFHIGISYRAPEGWSVDDGFPRELWLEQPGTDNRILVGSQARAATRGCGNQPVPGAPGYVSSASDIASWMAGNPDLETSVPRQVTLGRLDALQIDVVTAPQATTDECGGQEAVGLFVVDDYDMLRDSFDDHVWFLSVRDRFRVYLLDDAADDQTLVVIVAAPRDEFDSFLQEAAPVLDSFVFDWA